MATVDAVTLEVFRNRLDAVCEEMETALVRSAVSTIIKEGGDASAGLFTIDGEVVAQAVAHPIHFGMLVPAVRRLIEEYPPAQMQDGDRFILNDPYSGGTHTPDVTMVAPIQRNGRTIALACSLAHHQDVGGKTPGSLASDATDVFQEGLKIPALHVIKQGAMDPQVERMLRANVRLPDVFVGDLYAQSAAASIGGRRFIDAVTELGIDSDDYIRELLDRTEAMTRRRIAEIPDGSYSFTDYVDNDGIVPDRRIVIAATVRVSGSEIVVDLTGSSPQVSGPVNCVPSTSMAVVYFVARSLLDPSVPSNAGCYRAISAVLPPGSVVNPLSPAPVNLRIVVARRIYDAVAGALLSAGPDLARAASSNTLAISFGGKDPRTGRQYVLLDVTPGGMGARPHADGVDAVFTDLTNQLGIPTESLEEETPLRVLRSSLRPNSGGAGLFRGGLGCERVYEVLADDVTISIRGERFALPPWGCHGGRPGAPWKVTIERADGSPGLEVRSKIVAHLQRGDRIHVLGAGGGGFGDPRTRATGSVREDVLDGRVSVDGAREAYGVVVGARGQVDEIATAALREQMPPRTEPIDRGVDVTRMEVW